MRAIAWIIFLGFMIQQFTVVVLVSTIPAPRIGVMVQYYSSTYYLYRARPPVPPVPSVYRYAFICRDNPDLIIWIRAVA